MNTTSTTMIENGHFTDHPQYAEKPQLMDKPPQYDDGASTASTLAPTPGAQRYNIKYNDWRARHGSVIDLSTGLKVYEVEHRYRKPTFSLNSPEGRTIGTANSSTFSIRMEMSVNGHDFELTPRHKISSDVSFVSPAFGGQTLTWEHGRSWTHVEYVLLDVNAVPIAKFRGGSCWKCLPWGNFGDFEIFRGVELTEAQRDEVLATGTTLAYRAAVNRSATTSTAVVTS